MEIRLNSLNENFLKIELYSNEQMEIRLNSLYENFFKTYTGIFTCPKHFITITKP